MTHNYRPHETWMRKGATVQMPNNTGTIENVVVANMGGRFVVLTTSIQLTGVKHAFPFSPWDMEQKTVIS